MVRSPWFSLADWTSWLNANSGAVTALVTAVYAFFTILLWRATRRQADLTRRMFEAGHRPYVGIESEHSTEGAGPTMLHRFSFRLNNHGSVPAVLTGWEASIKRGNAIVQTRSGMASAAVVVQPQSTSYTVQAVGMDVLDTVLFPPGANEGVTWEAEATYQGVAKRTYSTHVRYSLIFAGVGGGYRARHDETVISESE